ncbi:MAG: peptidylprolyl isomerase [Burkholderiaceae bacterium]
MMNLHRPRFTRRQWYGLLCWVALALPQTGPAQTLRASPQLGPVRLGSTAEPIAQAGDYIVAVVNSEPITNHEVRAQALRLEQQLSQQGAPLPPRSEVLTRVLDRLILERAQLQLARESGVRAEDAAVDQAEQAVARQNQVSLTELRRRLLLDGISVEKFRTDLREQILLGRLREREIEARARFTESDLDQFIREQQGSNDTDNLELSLAQILIAVPETANTAQVTALAARAKRALERARAGEDFAALAREYSDAPERNAGGVLGSRNARRFPELFVNAVAGLPVGGLTEPLRSGAGFHVLKLIDKRQAGAPGVSVTQTRARHILLRTGPQLSESSAIERLAEIKRRLSSGQAFFANMAREFSQDGSAQAGGDLGWSNPGQFVPEFEEALNSLALNQVSDPVVSRFGVHLIQPLERRVNTLSEREQREIARGLLREKKAEAALAAWALDVRGRAYVELREPPQ